MLSRYKTNGDRLVDAVHRFGGLRLLVIGDIMLDRFIWGAVSRISPEAPVPVVEVERETICLGGAANVAANVRALGAVPVPIGLIGADIEAEHIRAKFRSIGAPVTGLVVDAKRSTSVKTRIIAHHQQVCRADREDRSPLSPAVQQRLVSRFRALLPGAHGVIVSDYAKGVLSPPVLREILPMARAAGKPVCVDPKQTNLASYRPSTVITPNTLEAERASGVAIGTTRDLWRAARKIMRDARLPNLLVTRGEEGMALFRRNEPAAYIPTVAREVYDVTGAGDTVISTLALALATGLSMLEAAVLANFAAGIVVAKLGTACVTPDELIGGIQRH
jgi:D-beta-D-heptose 7-phosphate kinase/D-beta-D-heptose 1-phosphate adenosyltransferase